MPVVRTDLRDTRERAREERFEPTGNVTQTNVQKAIEQLDQIKPGAPAAPRTPVSAATVAILTTDFEVGIDTRTTAVSANLPSAAAWAAANQQGLDLTLFDLYGNANANNITPVPDGADVILYGAITPKVLTDFGKIALRPLTAAPGPGWYVKDVG